MTKIKIKMTIYRNTKRTEKLDLFSLSFIFLLVCY
nr:MAG TPA: hypothetical protein [Caudoviricetes sp.]